MMKTEAAVELIQKVMRQHDLAVVTRYNAHKDDEMLCDPIIWTKPDLQDYATDKGITLDEAYDTFDRGGTLQDRSTEEGWEILNCLLQDI